MPLPTIGESSMFNNDQQMFTVNNERNCSLRGPVLIITHLVQNMYPKLKP